MQLIYLKPRGMVLKNFRSPAKMELDVGGGCHLSGDDLKPAKHESFAIDCNRKLSII